MSDDTLVPIEQKTVMFYEDEITAVRLEDSRIMVPLRPVTEAMGLNWSGQQQRVNRDAVLSQVTEMVVCVTHTQGQPDQRREMLAIPLDYLNGWLFGINANRVKEEVRDRLIRYQMECYRALADAFQRGELTADPDVADLINSDSDAAEAYRMALAVVKLARNQLAMEATQRQHGARLDDMAQRLEDVEAALARPDAVVTQEQASQISQAVKAVAIAQGKRSQRNEFGAVYGELYRKFGITSYKMLPASKFEEAMEFLNAWYQNLEGEAPF